MPAKNASTRDRNRAGRRPSVTVSSSGRPSKNSVPIRVCTVSGVGIDGGTLAAYFGGDCANAGEVATRQSSERTNMRGRYGPWNEDTNFMARTSLSTRVRWTFSGWRAWVCDPASHRPATGLRLSRFCKTPCTLSESCKCDAPCRLRRRMDRLPAPASSKGTSTTSTLLRRARSHGARNTSSSGVAAFRDSSPSLCSTRCNWSGKPGHRACCKAAARRPAPGFSACLLPPKAPACPPPAGAPR